MSYPVPEFDVDTQVEKCDARVIESPKDTYGVPCRGDIEWTTEQVDEAHWGSFGTCRDCGALYTTKG